MSNGNEMFVKIKLPKLSNLLTKNKEFNGKYSNNYVQTAVNCLECGGDFVWWWYLCCCCPWENLDIEAYGDDWMESGDRAPWCCCCWWWWWECCCACIEIGCWIIFLDGSEEVGDFNGIASNPLPWDLCMIRKKIE